LEILELSGNQLTGEIPESICDLNINWSYYWSFTISNNQLCPPYPSCIKDYVGEQDTSNCKQVWACTAADGTDGVELWGVKRQILGHNSQLMLVRVYFNEGAVGYVHSHRHQL